MSVRVIQGDCLAVLPTLEAGSVDACVTDPPAGIAFMGKSWDGDKGGRRQWVAWMTEVFTEVHRVLKPGAHGFVWALPRTSHWTAWALEDAGFEVRDCVYHLFGSGFPKSLDVSKAIDRLRDDKVDILRVTAFVREARNRAGLTNRQVDDSIGAVDMCDHWTRQSPLQAAVPTWDQWLALKVLLGFGDEMDAEVWRLNGRKGQPGEAWYEREVLGQGWRVDNKQGSVNYGGGTPIGAYDITAPATPDAERWQGWGTALKPAAECWWLIRKPLAERTVAANVLAHGTGGLNIDGCRLRYGADAPSQAEWNAKGGGGKPGANGYAGQFSAEMKNAYQRGEIPVSAGRWPPNVAFSHDPECREVGVRRVASRPAFNGPRDSQGGLLNKTTAPRANPHPGYADADGTETVTAWECAESCAVAALDRMSGERKSGATSRRYERTNRVNWRAGSGREREASTGGASRFFYTSKASSSERGAYNDHPCTKPLALTTWLLKLVTPPGGVVLDPFAGSGTTLLAASRLGFDAIGIDSDAHACEIARRRLEGDAPMFANVEVS